MSTYYYLVCEDCEKEQFAYSITAGNRHLENYPLYREKLDGSGMITDYGTGEASRVETFLWTHKDHRIRFVSEHAEYFFPPETYEECLDD